MRTFKTAAFAATLALGLAACNGGQQNQDLPDNALTESSYETQQAAIDFANSAEGRRLEAQADAGQLRTLSDDERAAMIAAAGY
jgi:hypothetical protein